MRELKKEKVDSVQIALVNTNRVKPPIAPIGLGYLAETLSEAGHSVEILDLCWSEDITSPIVDFFADERFDLVGLSLRLTDDCAFSSRETFLNDFARIVQDIRENTDAPVVVGGVGFSVMPDKVMKLSEVDMGVCGGGEFAFVMLANRMDKGQEWRDVPNLVWWDDDGELHQNPPLVKDLSNLPKMTRSWIDNPRYFREGGQIGIETKRGCNRKCIYCADPIAKGNEICTRPPEDVVDEIEKLLDQGINYLHTCDSEFNIPEQHAIEICKEIIRRDLGNKIHIYAYCSPKPFSKDLAELMNRAGFEGIDFGVDHGEERMLKKLGRDFDPNDILKVARYCRETEIITMFDLLLGSPGETRKSIIRTIELVKKAKPDRVGVAVGVRVYPGTELARYITQESENECLIGGEGPEDPLFFIEPEVYPFVFDLLDDLIGDDKRFFFFDPSDPERNYNYNANQILIDAIQEGYRGAYWDILRRCI